jgi:heptosyltransferase-3
VSKRILVLRPGAIGDSLVAMPALLALGDRFPGATIEVAGNGSALPLIVAAGAADRWLSFDDPRVMRLFLPTPPAPDDPFLAIDIGVAWARDRDGSLRAALERRGAAWIVVAPSRPAADQPIHVARHLLKTLEPLDIDPDAELQLPAISVPAAAQLAAHKELLAAGLDGRPFVAVHAGSGSAAKNWPAERFAWVVRALDERYGLASVALGGPADADALVGLRGQSGDGSTVLVDRPLLVVAAILQQARAFLGNDSGLSHLAGLLGVPTLALFGPTDPVHWSPLGPRVRVLRSEPLAALPPEGVLSELVSSIGTAD